MALRWSIVRLLVRASGLAKRSAAATDRLGRSRFAIRLCPRADALREIGAALCTGNAEYSGALLRNPGLEIIEAVGVADIAAESQRRTQLMIDFASARGWTINTPLEKNQRGGSVMIGVENASADGRTFS